MRRRHAHGFTYIGLIILVAIVGLLGAAGMKMGSLFQRAAAEEELLEIGAQFSAALRSYAAATPPGQKQQPPSLQELLKDPRFPNPRRHLRKIFVDPVTGKAEWGIVYLGDKVGVIGVHSLSAARPLKVANFDIRFQNMENREHISDWKFGMAGGQGVQPALRTPPNSMTGAGPGAAPSLFAPGPGGESAGQKGGKPGDATTDGKGGEAPLAAGDKAMPPPAPEVEPEAAVEPPVAEPEPMQAQSDEERAAEAARQKAEAEAEAEAEEKEQEKEKDKDDNWTSSTTKAPAGSPPPPDNRARRR